MFKGTISLKDGTVVQFECQSATEFGALMSTLGGKISAPATMANEVRVSRLGRPKGSKTKKRGPYRKQKEWSTNDIVGAARIVRENLGMSSGLSTMVKAYIRKAGENRKRSMPVIYSITSDLKAYFKGDQEAVGRNIKDALDDAGLYPTKSTGVGSDVRPSLIDA